MTRRSAPVTAQEQRKPGEWIRLARDRGELLPVCDEHWHEYMHQHPGAYRVSMSGAGPCVVCAARKAAAA